MSAPSLFEVTWIEPQLELIKYTCDLRLYGLSERDYRTGWGAILTE